MHPVRFLPPLTKTAFDSVLDELNIMPEKVADSADDSMSSPFKDITCKYCSQNSLSEIVVILCNKSC